MKLIYIQKLLKVMREIQEKDNVIMILIIQLIVLVGLSLGS